MPFSSILERIWRLPIRKILVGVIGLKSPLLMTVSVKQDHWKLDKPLP